MSGNVMRKEYNTRICERLSIIYDDLTPTELQIMELSFDIIESKLDDIKLLREELYMKNIEIRNLKSYNDNRDY